ncbi:MAG: helix-turn-helix domain-containing protein [Lachnospiraceae bacterium]|nr:helix-turn-helix domain-containing protein [Lachnospiraceae bacterium]
MNERIRKLRRTLDLTQQKFADRLGVKRNTVAQWESGINAITDQMVNSICREFNVNEEWLRYGTGDPFLPEPSSEIDALARKYNMSKGERIFLEKYFNLNNDERKAVSKLLDELTAEVEREGEVGNEDTLSEAEIDREVESYREELILEARAEGESGASRKDA